MTKYTADMVSRNVTLLDNNVIEIKRYNHGYLKAFLYLPWFIIVMAFFSHDFFSKGAIYGDIQWLIAPEYRIQRSFEFYQDPERPNFTRAGRTFEEFRKSSFKAHGYRRYVGLFFILFPTFLFLCVASPRYRPMRIDPKRRLIYLLHRGELYITRYPARIKADPQAMSRYLVLSNHFSYLVGPKHGSLVVVLPNEDPSKGKAEITLGIYRPVCPYQNEALKAFMLDYIASKDQTKFKPYFKKQGFIAGDIFNWFYQFSLFPQQGYNEAKTEAKIQAWLAQNPENPEDAIEPREPKNAQPKRKKKCLFRVRGNKK